MAMDSFLDWRAFFSLICTEHRPEVKWEIWMYHGIFCVNNNSFLLIWTTGNQLGMKMIQIVWRTDCSEAGVWTIVVRTLSDPNLIGR
jgi:hypothetical protein